MPRTLIYKLIEDDLLPVGNINEQGEIARGALGGGEIVGRVADGVIFRRTAHDERELGRVDAQGRIHSHGLFEGGAIGWVDAESYVVRAGLIFGEEEVGQIEGPMQFEGGAALLLLFLPEDEESAREQQRK